MAGPQPVRCLDHFVSFGGTGLATRDLARPRCVPAISWCFPGGADPINTVVSRGRSRRTCAVINTVVSTEAAEQLRVCCFVWACGELALRKESQRRYCHQHRGFRWSSRAASCVLLRVCVRRAGAEEGEPAPKSIPLFPVRRKRAQCFQEQQNGCCFACMRRRERRAGADVEDECSSSFFWSDDGESDISHSTNSDTGRNDERESTSGMGHVSEAGESESQSATQENENSRTEGAVREQLMRTRKCPGYLKDYILK
ncbi:hypothetical protein NDU88_002437 [Pleurodeles waltl]|uniref:Uncharacterized protein n=1 Tax=Pleurodeles waltl TaxID=8319 RepID=A0AAV7UVN0_PLEWA|nr:hypothetical protein NDU88_002437 [Pleurodeles waltl]